MKVRPKLTTCDRRSKRGACVAASSPGCVVFCPAERASSLRPGACTHHPAFEVETKLAAMKEGGLDLAAVASRLSEPGFVVRLHDTWQRRRYSLPSASRKLRTAASTTTSTS